MLYLLSLFSDFDRQVSMLPLPSGKECWAQVHFDICWYWLILHDLRGLFGCTFHCFIPCVLDLGLHASVTCYYVCFQQLHVEYMSMPIMLFWSWGWPDTVESAMFCTCVIHLVASCICWDRRCIVLRSPLCYLFSGLLYATSCHRLC